MYAHLRAFVFKSLRAHTQLRAVRFGSDSRWCVGSNFYFFFLSLISSSLSRSRALCPTQMEEDPFNPDYVEVDRVLEVSYCEDKDTGEASTRRVLYLYRPSAVIETKALTAELNTFYTTVNPVLNPHMMNETETNI